MRRVLFCVIFGIACLGLIERVQCQRLEESKEDFLAEDASIWKAQIAEEAEFSRQLGAFGPGVRTSFCDPANTNKAAVSGQSGLGALPMVLKGTNPSVAYAKNAPPAYFKLDPTTFKPIGGFLYEMFEKVASVGGFTWNYVLTPNQPSSMKDDVYVANITSYYDIVAKVSFDTTARRLLGLGFTPPLITADIVFITDSEANLQVPEVQFFGFLLPFTYDLWGKIIGLMVLHATLLFLVDHLEFTRNKTGEINALGLRSAVELEYEEEPEMVQDTRNSSIDPHDEDIKKHVEAFKAKKTANQLMFNSVSDTSHPPMGFTDYMYDTMASYTNVNNYDPVKRTNKLLHVTYSFFIIVVTASYTANLASILIGNQTTLIVTSITDANIKQLPVCFRKGGATIGFTTQLYPNIVPVYSTTTSNNEVLDMLAAGKCIGAVLAFNDWQIAGTTTHNPGCRLRVTGDPVRGQFVSLPYKFDTTVFCTSVFGSVLKDLISQQMESFFLQSTWVDTVADNTVQPCVLPQSSYLPPVNAQFSYENLTGIFVFYYAGTYYCERASEQHYYSTCDVSQ